jgi:hypothetical protein
VSVEGTPRRRSVGARHESRPSFGSVIMRPLGLAIPGG